MENHLLQNSGTATITDSDATNESNGEDTSIALNSATSSAYEPDDPCEASPPELESALPVEPEASTTCEPASKLFVATASEADNRTEQRASTVEPDAIEAGTSNLAHDASPDDSAFDDLASDDFVFIPHDNAPLVTGAPTLDALLHRHGVPRSGTIYLDMEFPKAPDSFLLSLAKTALERGERVAYVLSPPLELVDRNDPRAQDVCLGHSLFAPFADLVDAFGLTPHLNTQEPADPTRAFRYLTASTPDVFERVLDGLLEDPATAPDLILVHGLEQLFQHLPLFRYPSNCPAEDEFELVTLANARLLRWLETYSFRCQEAGSTLVLSLSEAAYQVNPTTLFRLRLGHLLGAHTDATLLVPNDEQTTDDSPPATAKPVKGMPIMPIKGKPASGKMANRKVTPNRLVTPNRAMPPKLPVLSNRTLQVCLYRAGALLGKADVLVGAVSDGGHWVVDGSFVVKNTPVEGTIGDTPAAESVENIPLMESVETILNMEAVENVLARGTVGDTAFAESVEDIPLAEMGANG